MSDKDYFISVAERVDENAIDAAKKYIPKYKDSSPADIVKDAISTGLLFREIEGYEDVDDADHVSEDLGFNELADWVTFYLRKIVEPELPTCVNCLYMQDNCFCPIQGYFINPLFCNNPCYTKKKEKRKIIAFPDN